MRDGSGLHRWPNPAIDMDCREQLYLRLSAEVTCLLFGSLTSTKAVGRMFWAFPTLQCVR